jgi:hypothetical protein
MGSGGLLETSARAQPRRVGAAEHAASQVQLERAQAAIGQKDWRVATEALNRAFAAQRRPEVLYELGRIAEAQERLLEAQDLMRRYLTDPARPPDELAGAQAQRVLGLPRPPSGQLMVLGEAGAVLRVDDRLVGDLPLAQPLLLVPGEHRVTLTYGLKRQESPVLVQGGRVLEMRLRRGSGAVLISLLPAVLWVVSDASVPPAAQNLLRDAAEQAARGQQQALLGVEAALPQQPALAGCVQTLRCQRELGRKNEVEFILDTRVVRGEGAGGGSWQVETRLWHTQVETAAAQLSKRCDACSPEQVAALLKEATRAVLAEGLARHPGTLVLESTPPAAEVIVDQKVLGLTPFTLTRFGGPVALTVRKAGFAAEQRSIELGEGTSPPLLIELSPDASLPGLALPVGPPRRPRWRVVAGGALIAAGVVLGGFGISGLYVNGKCYSSTGIGPCTSPLLPQYSSGALGGGLLGSGLGLALVGSGMLVWPAKQRARQP